MAKTTPRQYLLYVEELEKNPILRDGKNPDKTCHELALMWEELAGRLNGLGEGPQKHVYGWKKVNLRAVTNKSNVTYIYIF